MLITEPCVYVCLSSICTVCTYANIEYIRVMDRYTHRGLSLALNMFVQCYRPGEDEELLAPSSDEGLRSKPKASTL